MLPLEVWGKRLAHSKCSINMGSFPYRGVGLEGLGKRGQQAFPCLRLDSGAQVRPLYLMRPGLLVQGHQESQRVGPMLVASGACLSSTGKHCKSSCCLQNRTGTLRVCASLCPAAGRSQTPCAWPLSSPRRASCERAPFPWENSSRATRMPLGEVGKVASRAPSGQDSGACSAAPHTPPAVFLPCT